MRRLVLTALLAVLIAMVMVPRLRAGIEYRAMRAALFDAHSARHVEAVEYFSARIPPDDPDDPLSVMRFFLIDGLDEMIATIEDGPLASLHGAFSGSREFVRRFPDAHLRAVALGLDDSGDVPYAQHALAQASSTPAAKDELARAIFDALRSHEDASVRRETIEHACWRFGEEALVYVESALRDASPEVARAAWLLLPHLDPPGGYAANFLDVPRDVAEAVLLAATLLGGDEARVLIDQAASSADADLADAAAYCLALLDGPVMDARIESVGGFAGLATDELRELEPTITDTRQRALVRLALTAREPTRDGVDEALLLAQDGLLAPREVLGALLHAGEAQRVMRVLLASGGDERALRGDQGSVLRKYFLEKSFRVPVPGVIPPGERSRALAFDALRAWWMCVGNRADFDARTRTYSLGIHAKTAKAPRD